MILDHPIFTTTLPIIMFSVTNVFLAYAVRRLEKSVSIMHMSMISERSTMQMLIDSESIRIVTPSNQKCQ